MICPMSTLKFVGTISLGLLTGVSYSLSTLLPTLALLPSATHASHTLSAIQTKSTRTILTLASISSLSLITSFTLASPKNRHPYLLWTATAAFLGGQGVEWWWNGLSRFPRFSGGVGGSRKSVKSQDKEKEKEKERERDGVMGSGYVEVERERELRDEGVNGEKVEMEMAREKKVQLVRSLVAGVGFVMGVVGIWGDGA